jgi:hypothetical protein
MQRESCVSDHKEKLPMAITHDYTLVCEQARLEMGGKFIVIGLFTNGIGTPQIPFPLPMLTFFNALRADTGGQHKFIGRLTQLLSGAPVAQVQGTIQPPQAGPVIMPMQFQNLKFTAFGTYIWSLEIEGQDPFLTQFEVAHVPPQIRFVPGQPPF